MTMVTQKIFYTVFIIQNFFLTCIAYDIKADILMTLNKIHRLEDRDIKQNKENLPEAYSISDKIKKIIKEPNYEAMKDMAKKLKDFFEFPFKYLEKTLFSKKTTTSLVAKNLFPVRPTRKGYLCDHIIGPTTEFSLTEVTEVSEVIRLCKRCPKCPPQWCLQLERNYRV